MKYLVLFIFPLLLFADFSASDQGRQIIALQDKPARGLVTGNIYTITLVQDINHALINTTGVGIHTTHEGMQWDFYEQPTQNNEYSPPWCSDAASKMSLINVGKG